MNDLTCIYIDPITSKASLRLASKPVTGINKLIQLVILTLMTSPGSDLLDNKDGAGMLDLPSMNIDPNDLSELYAEVSRKVSLAQAEILKYQIGMDVSAEEKLKSISIISLEVVDSDEVALQLRIENEVGRAQTVVV